MTGRAEVARLKQRLDATFKRADALTGDAEILSDFARYLCVLVSGYLEQAVIELLLEYVRKHASPAVQRHVERRLRRFTNANAEKLTTLLGSFDPDWRKDLEGFLVDEHKDAVDGIVSLKNRISHGRVEGVGVTIARAKEYYVRVNDVVARIADLCLPK
jgi:predicted LPLAT superfamily acyltransferase